MASDDEKFKKLMKDQAEHEAKQNKGVTEQLNRADAIVEELKRNGQWLTGD